MKYTPKQLIAFNNLAVMRRRRQTLHDLQLFSLAAQGSERAIKKQIASLKKDLRGS